MKARSRHPSSPSLKDIFGEQQHAPEERSIDDIVLAMCALLQRRVVNIRAELRTKLSAPVRVKVGSGELEHVILNLVSNALDILDEARVDQPLIQVSTRISGHEAILRVQDNGPGVSPKIRAQLFDLFASTRRDGLGLGLWLSRHIVERQGGQISLDERESGTGASFTVRLNMVEPSLPPDQASPYLAR